MKEILKDGFGLELITQRRLSVGAGSETYDLTTDAGRFILKCPSTSEINSPEREPDICAHLAGKGIAASEFYPALHGGYIYRRNGKIYHLQRFVEGVNFPVHGAPDWLLPEQARLLGRIHAALADFPALPEGIGAGFFAHMTPEGVQPSYENSLKTARSAGDSESAAGIENRLDILARTNWPKIDCEKLTVKNTHGDYFVSQLICGENRINAVIDWTSACRHPAVWEIFRSYVYADPRCARGEVDADRLICAVDAYLENGSLNAYDVRVMPYLYFYQIAVCDYYNQYFTSDAANRGIYLDQARFATDIMAYMDKNLDALTDRLVRRYDGIL